MIRASACPGLFRLVSTGDGGLCRVKIPLGRLDAAQGRALAEAAARFGNGAIEITNRANLQLRGIDPAEAAPLAEALVAAGLGPRRDPAADDVRNVLVSPVAGLDETERLDAGAAGAALLDLLESTPRFHALSPKFALHIDGGGAFPVTGHPHDLRLSAVGVEGRSAYALGLASLLPAAGGPGPVAGIIPPGREAATVAALLDLFLDAAAADEGLTRFRDLLARRGEPEILRDLVARLPFPLIAPGRMDDEPARPRSGLGPVGIGRQRQAGLAWVAAVPPLGRLTPDRLDAIARLAEGRGAGQIRLTPWQSLLLPDIPLDRAPDVASRLAELGLAVDAAEPMARLVACAGSAGCRSGLADVKADALALAKGLPSAADIHLTGCGKSCASARIAAATLVAVAPGRYDLFRRDRPDGAGDGFGTSLGRGLTIAQANRRLAGE